MSLNVNDYLVTNGDIVNSDNQVVNIVDLLGGGTPVSNQTLNKNDFPIHSGLVIGSDNKLYDLAQLISGSGTDVAEVEKIASTEVLFNEKLPIYEVIENQYKTNTLLFVEGIEGYTQTVQLTITPTQSARVNWGDDSDLDFIREETTLTHTYEKEGKYIIKIESPSGGVYILSGNAIVLTNCNLIKAQFGNSCNVRNGLSFPAQNLTDLYAKGQADFNFSIFQYTKLKEFYINNIDSAVNIPNDSFRYSTIEKITISDNFKTFGNRVFPNYIKEIHIETDPSNPHINFTFNEYTFANISEYTPVYIPYGTKAYFETNLPYFKTYIEVVDDVAKELHKKLDSTGNTLENENFYLGRDNVSITTQRNFEVESDNGGELSVNNGVNMTSTDGSTLNVGRNIEATADGNVVLTSGDNSSITLSDDVDITAYASLNLTYDSGESLTITEGSTNVFSIDDNGISTTKDITTSNTTFTSTSLVTKNYVDTNTINESIVDVTVLPTGNNIKDVVYRLATTVGQETTYSYYMGDSTNQTTTELSSSPTEPTAQEIAAYETDILSVIS